MKKTEIRINNRFIYENKDKEYFLSDISSLNKWSTTEIDTLSDDINVTSTLKELMKTHKLFENVNFCGIDIPSLSGGG